jgi:hypothetical protein
MRRRDTDDGAILAFSLTSSPNRSYKVRDRERDAACGTTQLLHVYQYMVLQASTEVRYILSEVFIYFLHQF